MKRGDGFPNRFFFFICPCGSPCLINPQFKGDPILLFMSSASGVPRIEIIVVRIHLPPPPSILGFARTGFSLGFLARLAFAESPVLFPFPGMILLPFLQRKEKALDDAKAMNSWVRIPYSSSGRGPWRKSWMIFKT